MVLLIQVVAEEAVVVSLERRQVLTLVGMVAQE
jgi:hypothetical protein